MKAGIQYVLVLDYSPKRPLIDASPTGGCKAHFVGKRHFSRLCSISCVPFVVYNIAKLAAAVTLWATQEYEMLGSKAYHVDVSQSNHYQGSKKMKENKRDVPQNRKMYLHAIAR